MESIYENDDYAVCIIEDALDEDGTSRTKGYGIINKRTGVREGTSIIYGDAQWRADQYASMIRQLEEQRTPKDPLEAATEDVDVDDVTIN